MRGLIVAIAALLVAAFLASGFGASACERFFRQGEELEWTRLDSGLVVDSGTLSVRRVLGKTIDAVQSPYSSSQGWSMSGTMEDEKLTLQVPRWRETWQGICGEREITGKVKQNSFVMRPLGYRQGAAMPGGPVASSAARPGASSAASSAAGPAGAAGAGQSQAGAAPGGPPAGPPEGAAPGGEGPGEKPDFPRFGAGGEAMGGGAPAGTQPAPAAYSGGLAWAPASGGRVPAGGISGGQEPARTLYICRAVYQGVSGSGKIGRDFKGCNMSVRGAEVTAGRYEVLAGDSRLVAWVPTDGTRLRAVAGKLAAWGGSGNTGPFICRAEFNNGLHPGQVLPGGEGCSIGYGGKEYILPLFEVLVRR